jgi:hypothetical protein
MYVCIWLEIRINKIEMIPKYFGQSKGEKMCFLETEEKCLNVACRTFKM